ncbi:MAG: hypothetical protein JXP34_24990 [Planctomycetes bacterium]|nr:hypothetical protein [Planctomycetota bacterium]
MASAGLVRIRAADPPAAFPEARAATHGPKHHFFGYYDKCPWDASGRRLLAMEVDFVGRQPKPGEEIAIGTVDLRDGDRFVPFARTKAWCWQQGTMLRWLPDAPDRRVIYNAIEGGRFVSVVRDLESGATRILPLPVYALSPDGRRAVTLEFARVHRTRPGYGYQGISEIAPDDPAPESSGLWAMDLADGENRLIVSLARLAAHAPRDEFRGAIHWVNHIQFNTDGSRFLFLHRWKKPSGGWWTRLFTANPDGSGLRLLLDHDMISHFDWRDPKTILAWARHPKARDRFYLIPDEPGADGRVEVFAGGVLTQDGHCNYSPDRKWVLCDTYPDRKDRKRALMLVRVADEKRFDIGRFYSPPEIDGPARCDLHPRWNRDGTQVCIDSAHEPTRQMYVVDVSGIIRGE